ncbi:efflux RND transporter periplasmic adaptor subunit [Pseudoalteromonas sp. S16_S37]|uniref:efflux RND transporter periplasmic adaptor subunit n=1 Tax=Pseudoalteromonas sp. S16_S37 TaxID=2720228 RepID=UPI001680BCEE|nr:efflux RND transporter periplasmic adaptor subunit [Pseudoalteromonas sp. S16_S37]MBD1584443.1 efflux RND transporter periplasmic adaptor subunit [Pseudoalteromonas sp. S16_S37]
MNTFKILKLAMAVMIITAVTSLGYFAAFAAENKDAVKDAAPEVVEKGTKVKVALSKEQPYFHENEFIGQVYSQKNIKLATKVSGIVTSISATPGHFIRKGEALLSLDSATLKAEITKSRLEIQRLEIDYDRKQRLSKSNTVSEADLEEASILLKIAKAELIALETRLREHTLYAPFDGIVGVHNLAIGSYLGQGNELFSFSNNQQLYVEFQTPRNIRDLLQKEQKLSIVQSGKEIAINIVLVDEIANYSTQQTRIRAVINQPIADGQLIPGDLVKIKARTQTNEKVVTIPEQSINYSPYGQFIFVAQHGRAFKRFIQVGDLQSSDVVVTSGLQAGEAIVVDGHNKLYHSAPISFEEDI